MSNCKTFSKLAHRNKSRTTNVAGAAPTWRRQCYFQLLLFLMRFCLCNNTAKQFWGWLVHTVGGVFVVEIEGDVTFEGRPTW